VLKWVLRHLPLVTRQALASRLRAGSQTHTQATAPEIMDVNAQAVLDAFRRSGVRTLIHGHTHRPAVHELDVDGRRCRRIVLGDWYTQGSVLDWGPAGPRLESMPRAAPAPSLRPVCPSGT
jgi:UDP-2,3-diacylglucosamine hydrolase